MRGVLHDQLDNTTGPEYVLRLVLDRNRHNVSDRRRIVKTLLPLAVLCGIVVTVSLAKAQHCAPIVESYLSQISVTHDSKDQAIDVKIRYSKSGGRPMLKYQIYLLAYLEKNEHRVPAPPPADLIDKQTTRVLHTKAVAPTKDGTYDFDVRLNMNELAKKIIDLGHLTDKDREAPGGWGRFKDTFRLAVFVPFLEDSTYSVLESLPKDKHECNYTGARALLFQPLPYSFSIHYGIVKAVQRAEGDYYIQINQSKPSGERQ
jgi:hypothetical protein